MEGSKPANQLSIKQALNKGFRKVRPTRAEIENLRCELAKLLANINVKESEEFHKGLLRDVLCKTAFSNYFVNTKDRSDLVIHNNKDSASSVGVIIETKRPNNKTEMPTPRNLNKKATQELLLYFLRERVTHKNFEIKQLIATDLYQWFIFDAAEFEKICENEKLKKHFSDFEDGRLLFDKTEFFYKEIAAPTLEQVKNKLLFTYFDIRDYESYLRSKEVESDKGLIDVQKILSPIHLLKLPFTNDSNTLNQHFYGELLHIIGLEEYKEKNKKVIRRKEAENRNEGSLIESAISKILSLEKLSRVKDIQQFGDNQEEQLFSLSLELVLTWVNRILFLKLLESQIVSYHLNNREYLFLNSEKVPEYDDLSTLFFDVLAKLPKDRPETVQQKFSKVPYLNSSLFEPTEIEKDTIDIGNLPNNMAVPLYTKSVLKASDGKMNTLEYLFRFLDAYDFSSEGKEDIAENSKTLINASVLGLIFEKINGYKDGSFFTPGFITMYMCRETIRRAVVQKFREQTDFDSDSFSDLVNYTHGTYKKADLERFNGIVNSLKICDPAVGSGHFLVSALNELIAIKAELGILIDELDKPLRDYLVDVENDELIIIDHRGEFFKYVPKEHESTRVQKTLFHEKLKIIENCLFGVDINPNSVKICRLRLWIELLKNAFYKDDDELETLPNIDINIKCGNSVISRYPLDTDLNEVLRGRFSVEAYRLAVNTYRNAKNKEQKHLMEKLIDQIKGTFTAEVNKNHPKKQKLAKLRRQYISLVDQGELFQSESKKSKQKKIGKLGELIKTVEDEIKELEKGVFYRNAFEWRFEFPEVLDTRSGEYIGFDIVIGNPPYGLFNKKQNQKIALSIEKDAVEVLRRDFPLAATGGINACRIFFNLAMNLSHQRGYQSMIIPFGILTDTTSANLRKYILYHHSFINIDAFPERDNIRKRVFEDVKMSTAIILTCKSKISDSFSLGVAYARKIETKSRLTLRYDDVIRMNPDLCPIPITGIDEYKVLAAISARKNLMRLGDISGCLTGEADMTFAKSAMSTSAEDAILVKGVQVDRYNIKHDPSTISQGEIEYLNTERFRQCYQGKKFKDAYKKRIILQGLTGINEKFRLKATLIEPPAFLANSCNYLLDKKKLPVNVIVALLNSKLLNFIFKCRSTSSNVNGYEVDNLPIPSVIDEAVENQIGKLVDRILAIKKQHPQSDTRVLENQIDELVYHLYNLTEDERRIVDGSRE